MSKLEENTLESNDTPKLRKLFGVRHQIFFLQFVSILIAFGMRTNISVAIIKMTEETYPDWDNTDAILSSLFWGLIVSQLGSGQIIKKFGPKWFLVVTMATSSIAHIATPSMAEALGSTGVIICRVAQGFSQGFIYPATQHLISRWSPLFERATVLNFTFGANSLGIAIAMAVTGVLCDSEMGWPLPFYVYGGIGCVWAVVFAIFFADSPATHRHISLEEKMYIEQSNSVTHNKTKTVPTPWKSMLTSLPVWTIWVAGCAQCYAGFTLQFEIPSYMNKMMNFDIQANSALSALPYFTLYVTGLVTSPISDRLAAKGIVSITALRKIFNSLGSFISAAALIYLAFIDGSQKEIAIVLLVIAVASIAFLQSGYLLNLIDVAPNHAGPLMAMINGTNNFFALLGPLVVGFLGTDKSDPILWRKVYLIAAGLYIVCGLFYDVFSTCKVQSWNDSEAHKIKAESQETKIECVD